MTFCERADSMWDGLYEQESTLGALLRTSDCSVRFYLYQQFNLKICKCATMTRKKFKKHFKRLHA